MAQTGSGTVDFEHQVHPILNAKCVVCHSQEKRSGGLSLANLQDTLNGGRSGATVRPGNGDGSLLIQRITGEMQPRMPLGSAPLSAAEIGVIRSWITEGARATPTSAPAKGKWEAPLTLEKPAVPAKIWAEWDAPVDRFVAAYSEKKKLPEPKKVDDAAFARRAYLDIWGLLPAPEALQKFVADASPDKRARLVKALLSDNRKYAENWISFWNDLLRNDEGANYYSETASRKSISSWLLGSLESNTPYNTMVTKLLNPVSKDDPDGFLIGVNWRGTISASQTPAMQAAQNTAQIFLGVNLKCNSCHDSFISKWKLKDAYAMASYFSDEPKLQLYRCDIAQQQYAQAAFLFPAVNKAPASPSLADRRAAAAAVFTDPRNGRFARTLVNRYWERLMGRGLVENSDEMDGEPWSPELLDWLASDFAEHGYDLKHLLATIITSRAYGSAAMPRTSEQPGQYTFRGPELRRLTAEEFADAVGSITGEWHVYQPSGSQAGAFTREWRVAGTSLTRALGRPIRDQVYSTRDTQATTLQALELVNGETLTHWLNRGAKKMLGELPPEPASVFDRPFNSRKGTEAFDVDVSKAQKLWLLVTDRGSYSPEKVEAMWGDAELVGPNGTVKLSSLKPVEANGLRTVEKPSGDGVRVKTPSRLVFDISGKGFTKLRGTTGIENKEITSDLNPQLRFLIFEQQPNMERLTPVTAETPLPAPPAFHSSDEVIDRVFWYALGRAPSNGERKTAEAALADKQHPSADGLADLLWAVMMTPEFQLIH